MNEKSYKHIIFSAEKQVYMTRDLANFYQESYLSSVHCNKIYKNSYLYQDIGTNKKYIMSSL